MKLYYHKTDGGAEYYSTTHNDTGEGTAPGIILRTDGNEIEVFAANIAAQGLKLVITGEDDRGQE